jgi:hypothetical protein
MFQAVSSRMVQIAELLQILLLQMWDRVLDTILVRFLILIHGLTIRLYCNLDH